MTFNTPEFGLLFIPLIAGLYWRSKQKLYVSILLPKASKEMQVRSRKEKLKILLPTFIRSLVLALMILALMRPQGVFKESEHTKEGIDIMVVLDVSASMAAEDLSPNRLEVAKKEASEFIRNRQNDRMGLVVFGGEAYTQCPLTLDTELIERFLEKTELNAAGDGTAIGMAIVTGLNRLKDSDSKSKVMLLITDGENNRGELDPISAAELSRTLGIKIYTIGIGKKGGARIPYFDPKQGKVYSNSVSVLDEKTLKQIASITKGVYFRAYGNEGLSESFKAIDKLEKTKIKSKVYKEYVEYYPIILKIIAILLAIEIGIRVFYIRRLP